MQPTLHSPRLFLAALVAVFAVALASCGGSEGPSVRAEPDTSTTSSTSPSDTTTTTAAVTTTTAAKIPGQITYQGLTFIVPTDWPVHDLATEPTTCARTDEHAVYLGEQGPNAVCPARILGQTDALKLEPINANSQIAVDQATQPSTINGIAVRIDPNPAPDGALTVVFTDQQVVAILTFGNGRSTADQILASVTRSQ